MQDESALDRARRWWLKAQELRWRASRPRNLAKRAALLRMAEAYEGMAKQAEDDAARGNTTEQG
jgi:hypothetical protein